MAKLSPVQLQKNLNRLDYPVSKKDLIKQAEEQGVDEKILRALKRLPNKQYETLGDVSEAIGKSE